MRVCVLTMHMHMITETASSYFLTSHLVLSTPDLLPPPFDLLLIRTALALASLHLRLPLRLSPTKRPTDRPAPHLSPRNRAGTPRAGGVLFLAAPGAADRVEPGRAFRATLAW